MQQPAKRYSALSRKAQRGSKPRCHLLTEGSADEVATRLARLTAPFAEVASADQWMPRGFVDVEECQLHNAPRLVQPNTSGQLCSWWLPATSAGARTPNFDIAATCTIGGRPGLVLIEAKAHAYELEHEACGRKLSVDSSEDRKASHGTIGAAIASASAGLREATGLSWHLSRDTHYQMSNRFAWAWKVATLGTPVVLIYLGFLNATEMDVPFSDHAAWERLVRQHSEPLFPAEVWDRSWMIHGVPLVPLIRSCEVGLS